MPNQPNDRHQRDSGHGCPATEAAGRFPAQSPYQEARDGGTLSWAELDVLPAGTSARRGLSTR